MDRRRIHRAAIWCLLAFPAALAVNLMMQIHVVPAVLGISIPVTLEMVDMRTELINVGLFLASCVIGWVVLANFIRVAESGWILLAGWLAWVVLVHQVAVVFIYSGEMVWMDIVQALPVGLAMLLPRALLPSIKPGAFAGH
jgi:hypothetical protein